MPELYELYDFESAVAERIKDKLEALDTGRKVYTFRNVTDLDKLFERIEVGTAQGEATGHRHVFEDGTDIADAWACNVGIQLVSKTGDMSHKPILARIRACMSRIHYALNNDDDLRWWRINLPVSDLGTVTAIDPDKGFTSSTLTYKLNFNIRPDVWPE